jgi:hypothetical protein
MMEGTEWLNVYTRAHARVHHCILVVVRYVNVCFSHCSACSRTQETN